QDLLGDLVRQPMQLHHILTELQHISSDRDGNLVFLIASLNDFDVTDPGSPMAGRVEAYRADVVWFISNFSFEDPVMRASALARLIETGSGLLADLEKLQGRVQRQSEQDLSRITTYQTSVFGILLAAFALSGLFLFHPMQREVAVATDRLSEVFAVMSQGLLVIDADGCVVSANTRLGELLDRTAAWSPVGRSFKEFVADSLARGDYGSKVTDPADLMPRDDGQFDMDGIYHDTPSGRTISVMAGPRAGGGWVLTFTDITGQKEDARNLVRAQMQAEESEDRAHAYARQADSANRAKSAFLAAMSHEIRTPMNGIVGMADLLSEGKLDADQALYVGTIRASGEALLVLIKDILDFSKIEAGKMDLSCAAFDLDATINDVVLLAMPMAASKGLDLTAEYAPDLVKVVDGDPFRVRQVLTNLIGNAVKFTPAGSVRVTVSGEHLEGQVSLRIAVADTGIGIAPDRLTAIFDEFTQADTSQSRRFEGTGLGLAISNRLVSLMGGRIALESEPGAGTTFTVHLDLPSAELPGQADIRCEAAAPHEVRPIRVLIAEDNRTNRLLLDRMLAGDGHDLVMAVTGREAVTAYGDVRPDLILMDVSMPELDGFAATAEIRALESAA
ncbi:MAG: ATP-binding protein, partial [Pseudomonadota bacterium]